MKGLQGLPIFLVGLIGDLRGARVVVVLTDGDFGFGTGAVEGRGFHADGAAQAPGSLGDALDEVGLNLIHGREVRVVLGDEVVEGFRVLIVEDNVLVTRETMLDGVAGYGFLAGDGFGACGLGSVAARDLRALCSR